MSMHVYTPKKEANGDRCRNEYAMSSMSSTLSIVHGRCWATLVEKVIAKFSAKSLGKGKGILTIIMVISQFGDGCVHHNDDRFIEDNFRC